MIDEELEEDLVLDESIDIDYIDDEEKPKKTSGKLIAFITTMTESQKEIIDEAINKAKEEYIEDNHKLLNGDALEIICKKFLLGD
jgi:hypothetical protein